MEKFENVTPEMIDAWKAKYGKHSLTQITVIGDQGETYEFILREPGRTTLDATASFGSKKDYAGANKVLISNCVLAGDKDAIDNIGSVYTAVLDEIGKLQKQKQVEVKKL
jgi:hypothetical protein